MKSRRILGDWSSWFQPTNQLYTLTPWMCCQSCHQKGNEVEAQKLVSWYHMIPHGINKPISFAHWLESVMFCSPRWGSGLCRWCHGELGSHHLPRLQHPLQSYLIHRCAEAAHRCRHCARASTHGAYMIRHRTITWANELGAQLLSVLNYLI